MLNASIATPVALVSVSEEKRPRVLFAFGDLVFNNAAWQVTKQGVRVPIRPSEYKILSFLSAKSQYGRFASNTVLQEHLYGECVRADNVVIAFIKNLRAVLTKAESIVKIETMYGSGYRLAVFPIEYVPCSQTE